MPSRPTEAEGWNVGTLEGVDPSPTFQLAIDPVGRSGAENMALDQWLLEQADQSGAAFLRLYRWDPPCLSLGRNEPAARRYDRTAIERLGLDVVRRPTGGRAVWHEGEVTYAVAAPIAAFGSLRESYRRIHERLADGLQALGVAAALASAGPSDGPGACFATPAGGEIVVGGRKLVGSAQLRQRTALLQHGSILLEGSQEIIGAISRPPSAVSGGTTLAAVLGRPVSFDEVAEAVVRAWGDAVTSAPFYRPLPPSTAFFSDPAWTWRR